MSGLGTNHHLQPKRDVGARCSNKGRVCLQTGRHQGCWYVQELQRQRGLLQAHRCSWPYGSILLHHAKHDPIVFRLRHHARCLHLPDWIWQGRHGRFCLRRRVRQQWVLRVPTWIETQPYWSMHCVH